MIDMAGKVAVVTGGASGMGRIVAQRLAGRGAKVFPPTYEGGKYATEQRVHPTRTDPDAGAPRTCDCVLLDSGHHNFKFTLTIRITNPRY